MRKSGKLKQEHCRHYEILKGELVDRLDVATRALSVARKSWKEVNMEFEEDVNKGRAGIEEDAEEAYWEGLASAYEEQILGNYKAVE
jgi:hypothetical protein